MGRKIETREKKKKKEESGEGEEENRYIAREEKRQTEIEMRERKTT